MRQWSRADVIAGVTGVVTAIGVVVALLAWLVPDLRLTGLGAGASPGTAGSPGGGGTSPTTGGGTAAPPVTATRYLADLTPSEGLDAIRKVAPQSLDVPCGTGQSDDRFRQVKYQLPGRYREVTLVAVASGNVDAETLTAVQVRADDRFDQQDRGREVARATVRLGRRVTLSGNITGVDTVTLRIVCDSPDVSVRFEDPRLLR